MSQEVEPGCLMIILLTALVMATCSVGNSVDRVADELHHMNARVDSAPLRALAAQASADRFAAGRAIATATADLRDVHPPRSLREVSAISPFDNATRGGAR